MFISFISQRTPVLQSTVFCNTAGFCDISSLSRFSTCFRFFKIDFQITDMQVSQIVETSMTLSCLPKALKKLMYELLFASIICIMHVSYEANATLHLSCFELIIKYEKVELWNKKWTIEHANDPSSWPFLCFLKVKFDPVFHNFSLVVS